ncbi:MAG: hypothetical protein ACOX40_03425 [Bacilli bacterium]|jgi:hypothetical protein|nr:hypothetical protein [Acholeplasmataceae bacterium]
MDRSEALKIWEHEFGDLDYAYDFVGRKIKREDYDVENQVGWIVGYMRPLSQNGPTHIGNIIIMHHHTAREKGDSYPYFKVEEVEYVVRYVEKGDYYFIEKVQEDDDED